MNQSIIYVGLDVDDTQYHGSAFKKDTGAVMEFHCRPTLKGLLSQLEKLGKHFPGCDLRMCYEASYLGYSLQRELVAQGLHCDVVAPTSIPTRRGKAIKTNRIDAGNLAQFYANGLLTIVHPPDASEKGDGLLFRVCPWTASRLQRRLQTGGCCYAILPPR